MTRNIDYVQECTYKHRTEDRTVDRMEDAYPAGANVHCPNVEIKNG